MKKIFISTAIDYVNAAPHLGHALEKIQADVLARHYRALGNTVFFLSGTDENSLKNVRSAEKAGQPIKEFVDRNYERFFALKQALDLSYDDFIRTTESRHIAAVQKLWQFCSKDIYKKKYGGLYCVGCEEFYKEDELVPGGLCPDHLTKPEFIEEENYFFKLINYADKIKKIIETDELKIIPESRKNELLSFINSGLQDFCISRLSERAKGWGIDVPNDSSQKIWVWFDALSNYISALGYGSEREDKFNEYWQGESLRLHVVGKGITRFHTIYWPAMLMSAGLSLPNIIFSHGYVTVNGQKMSKSLNNIVDPFELVKQYGADAVRYYLLREIPTLGDGDFTYEKFEKRYNSDLAKGLGNLFSRTTAMTFNAGLNQNFKINPSIQAIQKIQEIQKKYENSFANFNLNEALSQVWELVSACDKYIDIEQPWSLSETKKQQEVFSNLLYSLQKIGELLNPFMPQTSEKILISLNEKNGIFNITKTEPLFPRLKNV